MGCNMSRLAKATIALVIIVLLFMPAAMAATVSSIDATWSQRIPLPRGPGRGPESVAFDGQGEGPYSGISDGRVLKWNGDKLGWTTYTYSPDYKTDACQLHDLTPATNPETLCGRPLGLQFHHKTGDLYIADAYKGLMRVGPGGGREATVLVNEIDNMPLRFTNGVDVDQITGQVYFTDSSMNYDRSQHAQVTNTHDATGRLMMYDPQTASVSVLQAGLAYPNGVAISTDRTHLVVASTGPCKLLRHWISGSKAGTTEPFADLPGYPDNVRADRRGGYWVGLHGEKYEPAKGLDHLLAVRVGPNGKIREVMRGQKTVKPSEIMERPDGKLYIGTMDGSYVGVAKRK